MKILHYSTSLSRSAGGLYYSVSGLAKALGELGHEVVVVGGADTHFEEDRHIWSDVALRPFPFRFGRYGFDPRIAAEITALKPDLVHIQGIWSAASIYGRIATARRVPVVVSPRGMLDPWILARRPMVKSMHAALFERPMLARAHLHALNASEKASALAYMPQLGDRVFVVPNGIPSADATSTPAGRAGALYLGRLHEKKQVLELVRAWSGDPALAGQRLTIAGWGAPAYEAELKAVVAQTPNVDFVGPLYGEAKAAALRQAKFFILPSLSEGLPMAVLEAIQFGAVPIITDHCNLPELFEDGIALRMATDFSDFAGIAGAALAMDEAEFARRSQRAKAYAERYSWSNIARDMLDQYSAILETSPG